MNNILSKVLWALVLLSLSGLNAFASPRSVKPQDNAVRPDLYAAIDKAAESARKDPPSEENSLDAEDESAFEEMLSALDGYEEDVESMIITAAIQGESVRDTVWDVQFTLPKEDVYYSVFYDQGEWRVRFEERVLKGHSPLQGGSGPMLPEAAEAFSALDNRMKAGIKGFPAYEPIGNHVLESIRVGQDLTAPRMISVKRGEVVANFQNGTSAFVNTQPIRMGNRRVIVTGVGMRFVLEDFE